MTEPSVDASRPTMMTVQASLRRASGAQVGQAGVAACGPPLPADDPAARMAVTSMARNRSRFFILPSF
jgi:hypothetical protein